MCSAQRSERINAVTLADVPLEQDVPLLSLTASQIVQGIQGGEITASQILAVFLRAAVRCHERTNPFTEIMFAQAVAKAAALDAQFALDGLITGPRAGSLYFFHPSRPLTRPIV